MYLTSCCALRSDHHPVLFDTICRSSFHHVPAHSDFRRTDGANFQTYFEELLTFNMKLHNEMAIDCCVENFGGVLKALAASTPKRRPRDEPLPSVPDGIQNEIA